jgi:hypothetical protein
MAIAASRNKAAFRTIIILQLKTANSRGVWRQRSNSNLLCDRQTLIGFYLRKASVASCTGAARSVTLFTTLLNLLFGEFTQAQYGLLEVAGYDLGHPL